MGDARLNLSGTDVRSAVALRADTGAFGRRAASHPVWVMLVVATAAVISLFAFNAAPASAAYTTTVDEQGANDEPGQKDLTQLAIDPSGLPTSIDIQWSWDDTGWSGSNTGDACTLFDTDNDTKANFSLC